MAKLSGCLQNQIQEWISDCLKLIAKELDNSYRPFLRLLGRKRVKLSHVFDVLRCWGFYEIVISVKLKRDGRGLIEFNTPALKLKLTPAELAEREAYMTTCQTQQPADAGLMMRSAVLDVMHTKTLWKLWVAINAARQGMSFAPSLPHTFADQRAACADSLEYASQKLSQALHGLGLSFSLVIEAVSKNDYSQLWIALIESVGIAQYNAASELQAAAIQRCAAYDEPNPTDVMARLVRFDDQSLSQFLSNCLVLAFFMSARQASRHQN